MYNENPEATPWKSLCELQKIIDLKENEVYVKKLESDRLAV